MTMTSFQGISLLVNEEFEFNPTFFQGISLTVEKPDKDDLVLPPVKGNKMSIKDIVVINIDRESAKVTQKGFSVPLILVTGTEASVKTYRSPSEVIDDYPTTSVEYKKAHAFFSQKISPEKIKIGRHNPANSIASELNEIQSLDDDWYFLISALDESNIADIALEIEAKKKIFIAQISDLTIANTLESHNYDRTALIQTDEDNHVDAAWVSAKLTTAPGASTWAYTSLSGIEPDQFNSSEISALFDKNVNIYSELGGVNLTQNGTVLSGEFIDIIQGTDFIQSRLEERLFGLIANTDKIPYTNQGIDLTRSEINGVMQLGVGQKILAESPAPTVKMPDIHLVDPADKKSRLFRNITFSARYAGAIHKVTLEGHISV